MPTEGEKTSGGPWEYCSTVCLLQWWIIRCSTDTPPLSLKCGRPHMRGSETSDRVKRKNHCTPSGRPMAVQGLEPQTCLFQDDSSPALNYPINSDANSKLILPQQHIVFCESCIMKPKLLRHYTTQMLS